MGIIELYLLFFIPPCLNRPVNKLCYLEVHSRGSGDAKHNEQSSNQVNDTIENYVDEVTIRPRRLTAAS